MQFSLFLFYKNSGQLFLKFCRNKSTEIIGNKKLTYIIKTSDKVITETYQFKDMCRLF